MEISPPVARYQQVAGHLRDAIRRGEYPPGAAVPSETSLVATFGLSRTTIRQAIAVLRAEGLLDVEHGRGAFVRRPVSVASVRRTRMRRDGPRGFRGDLAEQGRRAWAETTVGRGPIPPDLAPHLLLEPGAEVVVRDRVMGEEGGPPVQLATSYYPAALLEVAPGLAERDTGHGASALLEAAGLRLRRTERLGARMATPEQAARLRLPTPSPVIRLLRVTLDQDDRPVEVMEAFVSGLMELVYEVD